MMPFRLDWYVPQRVIVMQVWGDISSAEIGEQDMALGQMLDSGSAPVHIIGDDRQVQRTPHNPGDLWRFVRHIMAHPSLGWIILVGETNPIAGFLTYSFFTGFGFQYRRMQSSEEALAFLQVKDSSPNWDDADPNLLP